MAANTIESTGAEGAPHAAGLPQMNAETFPSQIFWLIVTFGLLFIVMSRIAVPKIGGAIQLRKSKIEGDLTDAEGARKSAADALAGYESALAAARGRAVALADENRKRLTAEIDRQKAEADAHAHNQMAAAEARIASERTRAAAQVRTSAAEAATVIVERLIGVAVTADDAAKAVDAKAGS